MSQLLTRVKLGRSVRFRQEHLDRWISRCTRTTRKGVEA